MAPSKTASTQSFLDRTTAKMTPTVMRVVAAVAAGALLLALDVPWVLLNHLSRGLYAGVGSDISRWAIPVLWLGVAVAQVCFIGAYSPTSLAMASIFGAALGGVVYGVFNATSLVAFSNWTPLRALADTAWGVAMLSAVAVVYATVFQSIVRRQVNNRVGNRFSST